MQTWERLRRRGGGHPVAAAWRMVLVLGVAAFVAVTLTGGAAAASATHTGVATSSVYAPLRCGANGGAQPSSGQYVRQSADGSGFVYASRPLVLRGFTFYPADDGGSAAWQSRGFLAYIARDLGYARTLGQNVVRPTDQFSTGTHLAWDDAATWANMDSLICQAAQAHIFVWLDLSFMGKVLAAEGKSITDPANWMAMLTAVGRHVADVGTVAAVSFLGEPIVPSTAAQAAALTRFYASIEATYAAADPHHLLLAGGFIHMMDHASLGWWQQINALPHNAILGYKVYSLHDEQYLPTVVAWARANRRVLVNEEFGEPQYVGDGTYSGHSYNGLTVSRAAFYTWNYQQSAFAATIFWNLANVLGGSHYDVSARTPAVWAVVARYGVYAAAPAASIPPPAPSPAPIPIRSVPCTVTVIVGGQPAPESGTCSGTFQLGKG